MNIGNRLVNLGVAAVLLGGMALSSSASAAALTQVHGNVSPVLERARFMGHHNPQAVLDISVALSLENTIKLDAFLHDLHDPASPSYHKYLTPKQFTVLYCPSAAQVQAVVQFLKQRGITVKDVSPNNLRIHARASAATLESAFGVALNDYKDIDGTSFYAASSDPSLPANIAGYVTAVLGLDDAVQLHPHLIESAAPAVRAPGAVSAPAPAGFSPQQIATAYNWPKGANTTELTDQNLASGVTLVIATAFTYRAADLTKFWTFYGLPTHTVTNVAIDGATNRLEGETTLDIQRSGAMSPGSTIVVYEAANPQFITFDDEFVAIANDVTHNIKVVSTSWGAAESRTPPASIASEHSSFVQMTTEGMVILAAAGDNGASDGASGPDNADFPAVDPLVLAAGGTHLVLDGNNAISSESAWTGAGGADSKLFAEPGYETALSSGFTHNTSCSGNFTAAYSAVTQTTGTPATPNLGTYGCAAISNASRQSSDMSMDADPATGYSLYFNGRWSVFGGTSFVAPELAGLFAIVVKADGGSSAGGPAVTYCLATTSGGAFYSSVFHDITSGSSGFAAGTGWDHPTGWGTPNAANFITNAVANCEL